MLRTRRNIAVLTAFLMGVVAGCESDAPKSRAGKGEPSATEDEKKNQDEGTAQESKGHNLSLPSGKFYFLQSLIVKRNSGEETIKQGKSAAVAAIDVDAKEGDLVGISASARFEKERSSEEEGKVYGIIQVGKGNDDPRVAKTFSSAMTKQSVSMFYTEKAAGPKTYKYQLWNTSNGESITVEEDDVVMVAEVYRLMEARAAKNVDGYFLATYQKISKVEEATVESGDRKAILKKTLPLKKGDRVLVSANIGWRGARDNDSGSCDGAEVRYNLMANGKATDPNDAKIVLTSSNLDESTLQYYHYEVKANGSVNLELEFEVDGADGCSVEVDGYASMALRVFRHLSHLEKDLDLAYHLIELGYDRDEGKQVKTVKEGELNIQPIFQKLVKLYANDVLVYELANRVKIKSGIQPTRALLQMEHEKTETASNIARTAMSEDYTKTLVYLSSGVYTKKALEEAITLMAGGYQNAKEPYDIDDIHFRYAIYGKLAK